METTIVYWGYIGIMEKKMQTTIVYWGYNIGTMEKKMETTVVYWGHVGVIQGLEDSDECFNSRTEARMPFFDLQAVETQTYACLLSSSSARPGFTNSAAPSLVSGCRDGSCPHRSCRRPAQSNYGSGPACTSPACTNHALACSRSSECDTCEGEASTELCAGSVGRLRRKMMITSLALVNRVVTHDALLQP